MEKLDSLLTNFSTTELLFTALLLALVLTKLKTALRRKKPLKGEIVFITGAASGIGKQMATQMAQLGAKTVVADVNYGQAQELALSLSKQGLSAMSVLCDVTMPQSINEAASAVREKYGEVSILVNNAGIVVGKPFLETTNEECERVMKVNSIAHFYTTHEFLPKMITERKGHIVTIASVAGLGGVAGLADYCASKHAAVGFNDAMRSEMKVTGNSFIKFTCICPNFINTGMFEGVSTNWILPLLTEDAVVNRIVRAVQNEEDLVIMPRQASWLASIRGLVSPSFSDWVGRLLGYNHSMRSFRGRGTNS